MARIGIIGTGWGARVQVPAFRSEGLEVVALAGRDEAKTGDIAANAGVAAARDWREIVESPAVDLVSIVLPPSFHRQIAIEALKAGKHVLCEKPTALDAAEAEEMLLVAREHPEQLSLIDHELRFLPSFRAARAAMQDLGSLRYVEIRYSSPSRGDRTRPWSWWSDSTHGGGILGAVGSHFADAIRFFGFEIESVQAVLDTVIESRMDGEQVRSVTADDYAAVNLRLHHGGSGLIQASAVAAVDEPTTFTFHFERGGVRLSRSQWWLATASEWVEKSGNPATSTLPGDSMGGAFGSGTVHLARALRRALDEGDLAALEGAATFIDGLAQQRFLDAARESARRGGWVRISA